MPMTWIPGFFIRKEFENFFYIAYLARLELLLPFLLL